MSSSSAQLLNKSGIIVKPWTFLPETYLSYGAKRTLSLFLLLSA